MIFGKWETEQILGFSNEVKKPRPTGFYVTTKTQGPTSPTPTEGLELARFQAKK